MLNDKEKYNDSLIIWELMGGLIVGLFMLGLPFILWYAFKFMNFIKSENFKLFMIGFSFCPLWVFIFLKAHSSIAKKKGKNREEEVFM